MPPIAGSSTSFARLTVLLICSALQLVGSAVSVAETKVAARAHSFNVLFIGNSHLLVNNVPDRVRQRLQSRKGRTRIRTIAHGGARLNAFARRADVAAALKGKRWNIVVLQEATATFTSPGGRQRFRQAIGWFERHVPRGTRIVLYQTWPWRAGSRFLRGRAVGASGLWSAMQAEYAKVSRRARITVAPVGRCWMRSARRHSYYSADGNHATVIGSRVAAAVIARTILSGRPGSC